MKILLAAASLVLAATAPAPAAPAAAAATSCVANTATGSCQFQCLVGGTISITVGGAGSVQGNATCGGGSAHCTGRNRCSASDRFSSSDTGWCDLTTGSFAICSAAGDAT